MKKDQALGIIRHILTLVGGGLVASGQLDEGVAQEGAGLVIGLIGFLWSILEKRNR